MSGNDNPGNFANRSADDVKAAASKGGQTGTENSGFASMPKEKVVRVAHYSSLMVDTVRILTERQQEIASMGGKASGGSFEAGSDAAKEAGRKGGQSGGSS